uniref:Uncharacterized protein n=1 Tax=Triticum aestivum TaxID=4565 RepID=A0A3B6IQF0_WHEAT
MAPSKGLLKAFPNSALLGRLVAALFLTIVLVAMANPLFPLTVDVPLVVLHVCICDDVDPASDKEGGDEDKKAKGDVVEKEEDGDVVCQQEQNKTVLHVLPPAPPSL